MGQGDVDSVVSAYSLLIDLPSFRPRIQSKMPYKVLYQSLHKGKKQVCGQYMVFVSKSEYERWAKDVADLKKAADMVPNHDVEVNKQCWGMWLQMCTAFANTWGLERVPFDVGHSINDVREKCFGFNNILFSFVPYDDDPDAGKDGALVIYNLVDTFGNLK